MFSINMVPILISMIVSSRDIGNFVKKHLLIFLHFSFNTNVFIKDLYSTAPKRVSVFIGLMTPDGAIWSRYQRTVLMS